MQILNVLFFHICSISLATQPFNYCPVPSVIFIWELVTSKINAFKPKMSVDMTKHKQINVSALVTFTVSNFQVSLG